MGINKVLAGLHERGISGSGQCIRAYRELERLANYMVELLEDALREIEPDELCDPRCIIIDEISRLLHDGDSSHHQGSRRATTTEKLYCDGHEVAVCGTLLSISGPDGVEVSRHPMVWIDQMLKRGPHKPSCEPRHCETPYQPGVWQRRWKTTEGGQWFVTAIAKVDDERGLATCDGGNALAICDYAWYGPLIAFPADPPPMPKPESPPLVQLRHIESGRIGYGVKHPVTGNWAVLTKEASCWCWTAEEVEVLP